jgi:2,5-diketo-D-gluconate reductase A
MEKENIARRNFLKNTSRLAAASMVFPLSSFGFNNKNVLSINAPNIPFVTLKNGIKMPILGFGTFMLRDELCKTSVANAISLGYRLIDTATVYGNESAIGAGIKQSGIERKELFITSKVWIKDPAFENCKKEFEISLNKLGTDYLDLYLIHRPRGNFKATWQAMEELYKTGKTKALGISNFEPGQIDELQSFATIMPTVNQIESHTFFQETTALKNLENQDIIMEAWAPLAEGRNGLFSNQVLDLIGKKYHKTVAQVCLRWHFQRGIVSIPRSSNKEHMLENLNIFDFELTTDDMSAIAQLDLNKTQFPEW